MDNVNNLKNHFLLAMPQLDDQWFGQSVCYICNHDESGSMGLVINKPIGMDLADIFSELKIETEKKATQIIMQGGPVSPEQGFILYQGSYNEVENMEIAQNIRLTSSKDILENLAHGAGPENSIICLGYAGWGAGQLEQELIQNSWLTIPADEELLFHTPMENIAQKAANKLGISLEQLNTQSGHA